ncbi:MAG: queuosine precursor transporter [SAR324 cluster bacterium]|nr:queuosine precursor transporter [SAR324 cluster bacterium]
MSAIKFTKAQLGLVWLVGINTALLVASNAAGGKMIQLTTKIAVDKDTGQVILDSLGQPAIITALAASATVFSYALSFLLTDIISEVYGPKAAKTAVKVGFLGLLIAVGFFSIAILATPASFWPGQEAYKTTLGLGPRILAGGWLSYLVSQFIDVTIFEKIKSWTKEKFGTTDKLLWLRNNASTLISQFIDSCIFITVAFYHAPKGIEDINTLVYVIAGQYLIKVVIALCDTAVFYPAVAFYKKKVISDAP